MNPLLEGWVTLGALAASVPDLRLDLLVGGNACQHPGVVANMALTLDHVFGGRTVPGLGRLADQQSSAAWHRVAVGQDPLRHARGSGGVVPCRVRRRWAVGRLRGERYTLPQMSVHPAPVNGTIPIMIGGAGHRRTLRAIARSADEWNAWGRPVTIARHLEVLPGRCEVEGRSFDDLQLTAVGLLILVDDTETSATLCESLDYAQGSSARSTS